VRCTGSNGPGRFRALDLPGELECFFEEPFDDLALGYGGDDVATHEDLTLTVTGRDADIGVPRLAGAVDDAAHDGDAQRLRKVFEGGFDAGGEFVDVDLEASTAGQGTISSLRGRRPNEDRMWQPALTCSAGGADSETRMVSPIPSDSRTPMATADLMEPWNTGPASVTPRCRG
jgi:hypothetical protein